MAASTVALVPLGVATVAAAPYTGSSTEYWAVEAARAQEAEQRLHVFKVEEERTRLQRRQRIFTWMYNTLAVVELVYFVVGLYLVEWQVADLQDNPLLGPGPAGVAKMGGTHTQHIIQKHQYWRLLSSLFYNAGAIHVAANLGMVWTFGHFLVRQMTPLFVALIFLGAGLAGIMVSANVGAEHMTAAASIPPFALAGAATAMLVFQWRRYSCHLVTALMLVFFLGTNAFIGATPFVDNSGNAAGFVFGAVLCGGFMLLRSKRTGSKTAEAVLFSSVLLTVAVVLTAVVAGLAGLQMDTPVGGCCNVWVCTPSPWWNCEASRIWPTTCTLTTYVNSSAVLTCPRGDTIAIPGSYNTTTNADTIQLWCDTWCVGSGSSLPGESGASSSMGGTTQ